MKIQLVQTKLGEKVMKNGRDMMVFPLGIAAIATYVLMHNSRAQIELIDGDFEDDLENCLTADVVGITPTILNFDQDLMKTLHDRGQIIVIGGVLASQASEDLVKFPFVDYVCLGDGEQVMLEIASGKKWDDIDGLTSKTKKGKFQRVPIESLPPIERELYDQKRYMENSRRFIETYLPSRPFRRMTNIYSNKGCVWRAQTGGCYFCGRLYGKLTVRPPKQVWDEVQRLVTKYQVDFLWDVSDSFISDKAWLKEMVTARPKNIRPYWYVYSRTNELLDEEVIALLQQLNVYQVLVGVETGDDDIAKAISKGNVSRSNVKIAQKLHEHNIKLLPSFVVGLPGESEASLEKTYQHAKTLVEINQCEELSVSMLIPLPGAKAYIDLKKLHFEHTGQALPPIMEGEALQRLWFEYKCNVDFDTAVTYMFKMLALTPLKSTFGSPYLHIDPRMPGWNQLSAQKRRDLFNQKQAFLQRE